MNNLPPWLSKWARSPRQDRRVVENGKFVEQGQVQLPEPPPVEEQVEANAALEVVHEPVDTGASAGGNVQANASQEVLGNGDGTVDQPQESTRSTGTGTVDDVPNAVVSTTEEQSVSNITLHGFVEKYNDSVNDPSHLTEEQSDALAETLRLPEETMEESK